MSEELRRSGQELADRLLLAGQKIVLAESCTAGLAAATLAATPGASAFLCGSAVTYRNDTKAGWLDVSRTILEDRGAVNEPVVTQMAVAVLRTTPEADLSGAISGHLGPNAPPELDGHVWIATQWREGLQRPGTVSTFQLAAVDRAARQDEAAYRFLAACLQALEDGAC